MPAYREPFLFGSREIAVDGGMIDARGCSRLFPGYAERFPLADLLPEYATVHRSSLHRSPPFLLLWPVLLGGFLVVLRLRPVNTAWFAILFALILACAVATLVLVLHRSRWFVFSYRSGAPAFAIGPGGGRQEQEAFATALAALVREGTQDTEPVGRDGPG